MDYQRIKNRAPYSVLILSLCAAMTACGPTLQRRVDVNQPSGADNSIDSRFGLTADAQDPSEKDKELGYGRWKAKPETDGTANSQSSTRRGETWKP
jgi:hypothetical protein